MAGATVPRSPIEFGVRVVEVCPAVVPVAAIVVIVVTVVPVEETVVAGETVVVVVGAELVVVGAAVVVVAVVVVVGFLPLFGGGAAGRNTARFASGAFGLKKATLHPAGPWGTEDVGAPDPDPDVGSLVRSGPWMSTGGRAVGLATRGPACHATTPTTLITMRSAPSPATMALRCRLCRRRLPPTETAYS